MSNINLIHGDCLVEMQKLIDEGVKVDCIITDPPYWHKKSPGKPYSQRKQAKTNSSFANSPLFNAEGSMMARLSDFNGNNVGVIMPLLARLCVKMNCYIFCNETLLPYYAMWAEENNYHFSVLVWRKPLSIINKNRFSQNVEFVVRIYEYGTALNKLDTNFFYDRVIDVKPINGAKKRHPTEKPTEIMERFIHLNTNDGDLVFDPFMGSGTTGVACLNTNRKFIGIELDDKYFKIAEERISTHTAQMRLF